MNLLHAEYYEQERRNDFLREAAAERLANAARRAAVRRPTTPGPRAPRGLGRLLLFLRRAAA